VGIGKQAYMALEHGESLNVMRRIKALFDPHNVLNPSKVLN
jgi:D-lactate dehydrogenase (cytochrome)